MTRRGNSEGSISKRSDGRWMARLTLPNGQRKSYYGKTRQEVARKLQDAQSKLADNKLIADRRQRVGAFLNDWLESGAVRSVRPKTLKRYRDLMKLHVEPEIGRVVLADLKPAHVNAMLASVEAKGVSPRTVAHCRAVLRNALNWGIRSDIISDNAAEKSDAPRVPKKEFEALTPNTARRILEAVKGDRLEALFTVALASGLRQSEALGLRWGDVNLESSALFIQRTLQRVDGAYQFFEPKSDSSRRAVGIPGPVIVALKDHKLRQLQERLKIGVAWQGETWGDLVFTNEVGAPLSGFYVTKKFQKLLTLAGLPVMRYHDLRQGAASLMAAQGVPARVAMEVLGHSDIKVTMNVYTHIASDLAVEAANKVAAAIWNS